MEEARFDKQDGKSFIVGIEKVSRQPDEAPVSPAAAGHWHAWRGRSGKSKFAEQSKKQQKSLRK